MRIGTKVVACAFALASTSSQAAEIAACVVDSAIPDNPVYYYLPTTGTKLRCEVNRANYHPTLRDLYADGWRLIAITDPKVRKPPGEVGATGGDRPSPILYMERDSLGSATGRPPMASEPESQPERRKEKESGGFFGLF